MTTQPYEPHWEMHGFTGKQHLIVLGGGGEWWLMRCGRSIRRLMFVTGNYERGVNRCRSCDRSAL